MLFALLFLNTCAHLCMFHPGHHCVCIRKHLDFLHPLFEMFFHHMLDGETFTFNLITQQIKDYLLCSNLIMGCNAKC